MWNAFVDVIRATIFAGSHLFSGSVGASIFAVSIVVRLALLPLMLHSARLARAQQQRLRALKSRLDRLHERYASDPVRLMKETSALHREHGIQFVSPVSLASALIQMPLLGGLFAAVRGGLATRVRFLWVADLSRGDILLTSIVVGLTGVANSILPPAPSTAASRATLFAIMAATLLFLWSSSSAVALSVGASSAVSALQNWILRRERDRTPR